MGSQQHHTIFILDGHFNVSAIRPWQVGTPARGLPQFQWKSHGVVPYIVPNFPVNHETLLTSKMNSNTTCVDPFAVGDPTLL
jgi:hypothetical protein